MRVAIPAFAGRKPNTQGWVDGSRNKWSCRVFFGCIVVADARAKIEAGWVRTDAYAYVISGSMASNTRGSYDEGNNQSSRDSTHGGKNTQISGDVWAPSIESMTQALMPPAPQLKGRLHNIMTHAAHIQYG